LATRDAIFKRRLRPNIPKHPHGREPQKHGRKQRFNGAIFASASVPSSRLSPSKTSFSLPHIERVRDIHSARKTLAYTLIGLWPPLAQVQMKRDRSLESPRALSLESLSRMAFRSFAAAGNLDCRKTRHPDRKSSPNATCR
jgi:hypothetical protein